MVLLWTDLESEAVDLVERVSASMTLNGCEEGTIPALMPGKEESNPFVLNRMAFMG